MQDTFKKIFLKYYPVVKRFALMFVKREEDAEDITQDVFASLWPKSDIWYNNPQIDRYICRTARNKCLNFLKRNSVASTTMTLPIEDATVTEIIGAAPTPEEAVCFEELKLLIQMSIEQMPARRRQIFAMSRFDGMSNKDIATMLGLSVRTVESHLFTALTDLRRQIKLACVLLTAFNIL